MEKDWFYHGHNISAKLKDKKSNPYKKFIESFKEFYNNEYLDFQKKQMEITGTRKEDIIKKVELLEDYYNKIEEFIQKKIPKHKRSNLKSQAKFEKVCPVGYFPIYCINQKVYK